MHISDLKAYTDSTPPFSDDRQVEQSHGRLSRNLQTRSEPVLPEQLQDHLSPDIYKGNFIDIYI